MHLNSNSPTAATTLRTDEGAMLLLHWFHEGWFQNLFTGTWMAFRLVPPKVKTSYWNMNNFGTIPLQNLLLYIFASAVDSKCFLRCRNVQSAKIAGTFIDCKPFIFSSPSTGLCETVIIYRFRDFCEVAVTWWFNRTMQNSRIPRTEILWNLWKLLWLNFCYVLWHFVTLCGQVAMKLFFTPVHEGEQHFSHSTTTHCNRRRQKFRLKLSRVTSLSLRPHCRCYPCRNDTTVWWTDFATHHSPL